MTNPQSSQQQSIQLSVAEAMKTGIYANVLAVTINPNEVVLDFAYRMPGNDGRDIQIVSRVNLSHETAKQVVSTLQNSILDYENKVKAANTSSGNA